MNETPPCRPWLPPEWAPQSGVMLTWPHANSDWAPILDAVEPVFVEIARQICRFERVVIVCADAKHRAHVDGRLRAVDAVFDRMISERSVYAIASSNDTWARDHGPITVLCREEPTLLDFRFNGWGGKYPADLDDTITQRLHTQGIFGSTRLRDIDFVLEGGSIEVDGQGTLLTTRHCLLSPQRNPDHTREDIETRLKAELGLTRVLWLDHGALEGDDTDSHIDTLVRFCGPRTLAYVRCDDRNDPHHDDLAALERELLGLRALDGRAYDLVPLPWPAAKYDDQGNRLPATYANFLIINHAVLVPTYRDAQDAHALAALRHCFPKREVIGIDCLPLIWQHGSLHCVTMQIPEAVLLP